jgi:hypothetical protein
MSPLERESRVLALHEQRRAAGRIRVAQPGAALARRKGFESVMQNRPEVLLWLKKRIKNHNKHMAGELGITHRRNTREGALRNCKRYMANRLVGEMHMTQKGSEQCLDWARKK